MIPPLRLLLLAGTAWALAACSEKAAPPAPPRPVRTVEVQPTATDDVLTQTGAIQARVETDLAFRVAGRVVGRSVEVGARVKAGETLAALDDGDLANELRATEAELNGAQAAAEAAQAALKRQKSLFEKQLIARSELDAAEAEARTSAAREKAANAALANARNRLAYTRLIATDAGVVTAIGANAGQVVGAGQMIVRVAADGAKEAVFDVSERHLAAGSMEMPVVVALASDPRVVVRGSIREVSPAADPITRTYRVRVTLPDAPEAMSLGATVTGTVELPAGKLIAVPGSAITSKEGAPAVFVVDLATGKLALRPVSVARYTGANALIASGLAGGDRVVTAGVSKLRPEQVVKLEVAP